MRVGLMTREYPPYVYGGAGVHVEYLSRELAKKIEVEVHAWGAEPEPEKARPSTHCEEDAVGDRLSVHFEQPWDAITHGTDAKFKGALEALSLNLLQQLDLAKLDIVHTHTWYVAMAGFLAKKLYGIPFVLTTHSLEPLRAWKAEQLGSGYALSSWMERTAVLDADAIVAVSNGTKADILKAYPEVDAAKIHVIYNGIDLNQYQYTPHLNALLKYGVDPQKPYVLFVGRITRQKGVTHLVEAIQYLPPGTQVVLCAGAPDTRRLRKKCATRSMPRVRRRRAACQILLPSKATARPTRRAMRRQRATTPARATTSSGSSRWCRNPRRSSCIRIAPCSAALACMSRSASSTWRRWPAARLLLRAQPRNSGSRRRRRNRAPGGLRAGCNDRLPRRRRAVCKGPGGAAHGASRRPRESESDGRSWAQEG